MTEAYHDCLHDYITAIRAPVIATVHVDGSGLALLTTRVSGSADLVPNWSPTGDRITYVSFTGNPAGLQLRVMNADGSGNQRMTYDPKSHGDWWEPDWTA